MGAVACGILDAGLIAQSQRLLEAGMKWIEAHNTRTAPQYGPTVQVYRRRYNVVRQESAAASDKVVQGSYLT